MKVYSKNINEYNINFVTTREIFSFNIRLVNTKRNEERILQLVQSTQHKNLFLIEEFNFQFKITTIPIKDNGYEMYKVSPANQDTMYRLDMLCLTESIIIIGFEIE